MSLSQQQYMDILNGYSNRRRSNHLKEQQRREEIYHVIPDIRKIDEQIAFISLQKTRYMLFHPETDKKEELHREIYALSMEKVNLLAMHGYPPDYLDPIYTCRSCQDTGYIGDNRCSCFHQYIADILYNQSNLKDILDHENFSTFCIDFYSKETTEKHPLSPRDNIKEVLNRSYAFIRQFDDPPGQNLLIYGNAGVGKTFLSNCIAGELLKKGKSVIYLTAYQFFHQLEDYTFRREEENADTLSWLLNCDLLIIDDLGTEMNNAFINSRLFLCMNERILKKKSTIINTNLSLKQLSRTYSERISSRIIESYALMHIYGEDIRIKKAVSSLD